MRLWLRHPIRWRRCVRDSREYMADRPVLNLTPGVLYTIRYGVRRRKRPI